MHGTWVSGRVTRRTATGTPACSAIVATTSAPNPPEWLSSCTTITRRARRAAASTASESHGLMERRSTRPQDTPAARIASAARRHRGTVAPQLTSTTSSPSIPMAACPGTCSSFPTSRRVATEASFSSIFG